MPRLRPIAAAAAAVAALCAAGPAAAQQPVATIPDPIPNDPGRDGTGGWQQMQWNFLGQGYGIDVPGGWANTIAAGNPGASNVTVAVLDTGVAYANRGPFRRSPDLAQTRFVRGYDFVDRDPYPNDRNGHGTHVASTIAESTNNGIALTGIAYNARIMPIRVLDNAGEGDIGDIADGVRFATRRGADIINLSLEFSVDVQAREIRDLLRAMHQAHQRGVLVVGASGNEAAHRLAYPARAREVLAVGATTEHGCLSDYSNEGRGLDVVAPGGGPDAALDDDPNCRPLQSGRDIYQMTIVGKGFRRFGIPTGYEGTSMAVPHVSGVAALVIASGVLGSDPSPEAIKARLKATARDLGRPGHDSRYGAGLINARAATSSG
jgi:serine protease